LNTKPVERVAGRLILYVYRKLHCLETIPHTSREREILEFDSTYELLSLHPTCRKYVIDQDKTQSIKIKMSSKKKEKARKNKKKYKIKIM